MKSSSAGESVRTPISAPSKSSTKAGSATSLSQRSQVRPRGPSRAWTKTQVPRGSKPGPRPDSKTAKVLTLLRRPQGAGLKELLKVTGWQPHSMRGFLSGTVSRKMGLQLSSTKAESGERRYSVKA
jgi:hypothetical protein